MKPLSLFSDQEETVTSSSPLKKRNLLKVRIIKYLHQDGIKSIPDLCELVRVSSPTVKRLLEELERDGLVTVKGLGSSGGGRRPSLYGLDPDSRFTLGIDFGRYETRIGLFNLSCQPVGQIQVIPEGLENSDKILEVMKSETNQLLKKASLKKDRILGAGIAFPGLIDMKTGISYSYFNQDGQPAAKIFRRELLMPVFIEHDTRSMARGELMFGLAKGKNNVLCLNLGSGIGLSMILNGRVYSGESGYAGEFGHINTDPNGLLCYCGKIGCLETLASGRTLKGTARTDLLQGTKSLIRELVSDDLSTINLPVILKAAEAGDQYSAELLTQAGLHLGKGIATLIHLFNPEMIIVGGMMAGAGNLLIDPIQQNLNKYCIPRIRQDSVLALSQLGTSARILGAVALVMEKVSEPKN